MVTVTILAALILVIGVGLAVWRVRQPKILMFQWGKFNNSRLGLKGHKFWADEEDIVQYQDFRYWVRVKPNPGFKVPVLGYWSKAKGRNK